MRWVILVLAALALVFGATETRAQSIPIAPTSKPTAVDEATAKKNFESGLKLYAEGSYAEALIAFEQSYRLGGRASALKNIAQCHRNLKHFVEAYDAYEQMLARHEAQISVPDKKAVQQALEELGVLTAMVLVEVNEPDAEIVIDAKSAGHSPMSTPKRVAATGSHAVRVTKATFGPFEQTFTVESQQQKKIEVKLEAEKTVGRVLVREPSGRDVRVFVDGQDKGPAPWEGDVAAGEHVIEVKGPRFASESRKITIASKERLDVGLDAASLLGRLRVTTVPSTASIAIDGKDMGTGAWEGELTEGAHRIDVSTPGQPAQHREIALGRGQIVVQEIAVLAPVARSTPEYEGMYGRFSLFGQVGSPPPDDSSAPVTRSDGGSSVGAGTALRIGRSWGWYGAEAVGIFMLDARNRSYQTGDGAQTLRFTDRSVAANAFFGVGGRVTSKEETVRFTFGLAPGLAIRTFAPKREIELTGSTPPPNNTGSGNRFLPATNATSGTTGSGPSSQEFESSGYTAFAFVADGGVLLGSTPGLKFMIGVQAWLDFAPTLVAGPDTLIPIPNSAFARPGRGIRVVDGTQFYLGPTLGLQFGH